MQGASRINTQNLCQMDGLRGFLLSLYTNKRRSFGCECNGRMSLRTRKISGSNLGQDIVYPEIFLNTSTWLSLFLARQPPPPPHWARASSFTNFLDHTQRRATISRTPLDEWSYRRRDLYLKTHNTHDRHPWLRWDSNPQSQQASGRGPTP
jgi:hypothetical protein